jgi:hypothetical protein
MMNVGQSVEWELAGETKVLGENLPQCSFVDHKSNITWLGIDPRPLNALAMARPNIALTSLWSKESQQPTHDNLLLLAHTECAEDVKAKSHLANKCDKPNMVTESGSENAKNQNLYACYYKYIKTKGLLLKSYNSLSQSLNN